MMEAPYPPPPLTQDHVRDATLYAHRKAALACWPRRSVIAEMGVAYGGFTSQILQLTDPVLFDAYDLFRLHERETLWNRPTTEIFEGKTQLKYYQDRFATEYGSGVLKTYQGNGAVEIAKQPPETYDVIYIDADHSYPGVYKDTQAAIPALKKDGMLVFNDYVLYDKQGFKYGVVPVVNQLCIDGDWRVKYLALNREMFCDIALVRT